MPCMYSSICMYNLGAGIQVAVQDVQTLLRLILFQWTLWKFKTRSMSVMLQGPLFEHFLLNYLPTNVESSTMFLAKGKCRNQLTHLCQRHLPPSLPKVLRISPRRFHRLSLRC